MKKILKKTALQIVIFSVAANVVCWTFILLALLAPEFVCKSADMQAVLMLYMPTVIVGIAYIFFDKKLGLDGRAEPAERFVECFIRCCLWSVISLVCIYVGVAIGCNGLWITESEVQGFGTAAVVCGGMLMIGVAFFMVLCFFVREIYYLFKRQDR